MVVPKKQDFWPKINILKGNPLYFGNTMKASSSKSAKIVLSKSIFHVKNQRTFSFIQVTITF